MPLLPPVTNTTLPLTQNRFPSSNSLITVYYYGAAGGGQEQVEQELRLQDLFMLTDRRKPVNSEPERHENHQQDSLKQATHQTDSNSHE